LKTEQCEIKKKARIKLEPLVNSGHQEIDELHCTLRSQTRL